MEEEFFYEKYGVLVTNIRIEFGSTMYLIKNITSVQTNRIEKDKTWPVVLLLIGLVMLIAGLNANEQECAWSGFILSLVCAWWTIRLKDEYTILLGNAGGMRQYVPVRFKNMDAAVELKDAINRAMLSYVTKDYNRI